MTKSSHQMGDREASLQSQISKLASQVTIIHSSFNTFLFDQGNKSGDDNKPSQDRGQSNLAGAGVNQVYQNDKIVFIEELMRTWKKEREDFIRREARRKQDKYKKTQEQKEESNKSQQQRQLDQLTKKLQEREQEFQEHAQESQKQGEIEEPILPLNMKKMATKIKGFAKSRTEKSPQPTAANQVQPKRNENLFQLHQKMTFMNGKQVDKAQPIQEVGQNIVVLVSMNKETMNELIHQLSPHEGYVEIDKMRKIVYDESINLQRRNFFLLYQMSEEDFQAYRARLFHTNLTFFEKAIEKSKNNTVSNLSEIWHAKEIHTNFLNLQEELKNLGKKLKTVQLFMECVKPEAIEVSRDKIVTHKYQYTQRGKKICFYQILLSEETYFISQYMKQEADKVVERWRKKNLEKKRLQEEERKDKMEQDEVYQRIQ